MPNRRYLLLVVALFVFALCSPPSAQAAGCHTACNLTIPPDCLGCGFLMFGNVMCLRLGCNLCEEESCSVALPVASDQLALGVPDSAQASTCAAPSERKLVPIRVVGVQILPART